MGSVRVAARAGVRGALARAGLSDRLNASVLSNAGSLFGATLLTAALGSVYWAIAARILPPAAVGLAAAAVSAMMLVGQISTFGLGTVLMGELSQHEGSERRLIYSATGLAALVGGVLGAIGVVFAGSIVPELDALRTPTGLIVFAVGSAVTAAGLVLDQAFIGLLRGGVQLVRNTVASVGKLVVLAVIGIVIAALHDGLSLFLTWVIGGVVSMALILAVPPSSRPDASGSLLRVPPGVGGRAIRHHLLNLSILAPGLLLPLIVTATLSAEANAYFYIPYLVASLGLAIPAALSTAAYAAGARDVEALPSRIRFTFRLCIVAGIAMNLFMLVAAGPVLSIFGPSYADHSVDLLRIFSLGIFPVTINSLFVPIARVEQRFLEGAVLMVLSMVIEFVFVIIGAELGGLNGTGLGWLLGYVAGVVPFAPMLYRVAVQGRVERLSRDAFGPMPTSGRRPVLPVDAE